MLIAALLSGVAVAAARYCPAASAQPQITRFSCQGAILGGQQLGDQRLATYQDGHGHRIEVWCTRRIFDSQFDLRVATTPPPNSDDDRQHPDPPGGLATVGGCFFVNGDNDGPIIIPDDRGAYARLEWVTADPPHRRQYRFSYDFATRLVTITATARGCAPITKIVPPQASYSRLKALLPRPETLACAGAAAGSPAPAAALP